MTCWSVEAIAFNDLSNEDADVLRSATPRRWDSEKAKAELSFLSGSSEPPPATIPMCAQAVARRLQLDILREELPEVRRAIRADEDDGAHMSTEARQFCADFDNAPQPLTAASAISLFAACEIGRETIGAESGSDLLARTATRTLAVMSSAFSGQSSGLPKLAQRPMKTLRGLGLMIYLVVRYALEGSRFGAMLVSAGLFAGAALLGVGLVVDIPGILMVAGLGAMLAAVFLTLWKRKFTAAAVALVLGLLVALLPRVFGGWVLDTVDDAAVDSWEPVFVVAGLLVSAFVLGSTSFDWPEQGSSADDAGPA